MIKKLFVAVLLAALILSQASWAAEYDHKRNLDVVVIKAESATGWNRYLGQVRYEWDFLPANLRTAGINTVGVYVPGGNEPFALTPDAPMDAVLATIVDPDLNIVFSGALDRFPPNPAGINVPLRDVGTWTTGMINHFNDDINMPLIDNSRVTLPFHSVADIAAQAQAEPDSPDPITLGDWLKATGKMKILCEPDGGAHLNIEVNDLIPNRAYTIWAMWHRANGAIFPQPYGGAPNGYITDNNGHAVYERHLNFCPMDAAKNGIEGNRLLSIITHLHSDHILYGGVPTPSATGYPPGTVLHMQLEWNFPGAGVRLID